VVAKESTAAGPSRTARSAGTDDDGLTAGALASGATRSVTAASLAVPTGVGVDGLPASDADAAAVDAPAPAPAPAPTFARVVGSSGALGAAGVAGRGTGAPFVVAEAGERPAASGDCGDSARSGERTKVASAMHSATAMVR
jgi:hypothetical protein